MATRTYFGIAERAGDGWSISFPAFPGTVTTGDTIPDLLTNARNALASVVEAMQDEEQEIPQSYDDSPTADPQNYQDPHLMLLSIEDSEKSVRVNVTMAETLVWRLDNLAERLHSSRSALLAKGACWPARRSSSCRLYYQRPA
jgi:predicted RNase H-like HicB family nuclease